MMNKQTGRPLDTEAHVYQSIRVIIGTLIGTRIARRSFGSIVPLLIDRPISTSTLMLLRGAVFVAIARWEKRITLQSISFALSDGAVNMTLSGYLNDRQVSYQYEGIMNRA